MSILTNYLLREIDEAQQRSMRELFDAWDREIEAQSKALIDLQKRQAEQAAQDAALAQAVSVYINGLFSQAQGGRDVSDAVPADVRVESSSLGGTSVSELSALISAANTVDDAVVDKAQRSAAWALSHSFVPHPSDLASILNKVGVDEPWAQAFQELGTKIDQLSESHFKNPQLQIHIGAQKLHAVGETVRMLEQYTPDRTLRLVGNPQSLLDLPGKIGAPAASSSSPSPKMGSKGFNKMLDGLFS